MLHQHQISFQQLPFKTVYLLPEEILAHSSQLWVTGEFYLAGAWQESAQILTSPPLIPGALLFSFLTDLT